MEFFEKKLERDTIFTGHVFQVHVDKVQLQDDSVAMREVVEHSGGVAVLALDHKDNVLLVQQFRYGQQETLWELPAGKIDPGEDHRACGIRELEEETGYQTEDVEFLGEFYPTPAYDTEIIYLYVAKCLTKTKQSLDPGEFLAVKAIPLPEAVALCVNGTIKDAKTIIAILRYAAREAI